MAELLKLHVGCGKRFIPGFTHVDQVAFEHVDHVQDIRRLVNFADNSASLIYACQVIEYFDREEVVGVLTDWQRVLVPGGILRLSVPNFAMICKLYQAGVPLEKFLGTLYGRIPDGRNGFVYHRTTYDEPSLRQLLGKLGFNEIIYGTGDRPNTPRSMTSRKLTSRTWIRSTACCSISTCRERNEFAGI